MLHINLLVVDRYPNAVSVQWLSKLYVCLFLVAALVLGHFYQQYRDQLVLVKKQISSHSNAMEINMSEESGYLEKQRVQQEFFCILKNLLRQSNGIVISLLTWNQKEIHLQGTAYVGKQVENLMRQLVLLECVDFVKLVAMSHVGQSVEFNLELSER